MPGEHLCKGFKDISASETYASSDLKVFRGLNEEYYARDFCRCFPPEMPHETPHLYPTPREQSIFWRVLRPEFLRTYREPLSPDAGSMITNGLRDTVKHIEKAGKATQHLVNVTIPGLAERLVTRDYSIPVSEGLGLNLSAEFHIYGVNMRHIGLVRSLLWRPLPGTVNIYFHEKHVRTSRDLREETRSGDKLRIMERDYLIEESLSEKITAQKLPLAEKYFGLSMNRITAMLGRVSTTKNCSELRSVLLAEMVARTIKHVVKIQLRNYSRKERTINSTFFSTLVCDYINIVTGSNKNANAILQEKIYDGVRERFGPVAISPSEQNTMLDAIEPCIVYIVKRLQLMLGFQLSIACVGEFVERPAGFAFVPLDIVEISPVVRHNMPLLSFADAMLITIRAKEAERETYIEQVLEDKPCMFFRLSERRGARTAENYRGTLLDKIKSLSNTNNAENTTKSHDQFKNAAAHGSYSYHCLLELAGPIKNDPFSRAIGFRPGVKAHMDCKFHQLSVPQGKYEHFSVEMFCKCLGGDGTTRVALMNGRYGVVASREGYWTFVIMQEMHELNVRIAPVVDSKWVHLVGTFDGTTLRCYSDSILRASLEVEGPMQARVEDFERQTAEIKAALKKEEDLERSKVKLSSQEFADNFFVTKEGVFTIKKMSNMIMESKDFQSEKVDDVVMDEQASLKARRVEAVKQAKVKYFTDLYVKNVRTVTERFKLLLEEVNDRVRKQIDDGILRTRKGLRLGASLGAGGSKDGHSFFFGDISCVSLYTQCLSADRIRSHYLTAVEDKTKDAQRLHAEASAKFEEALHFAPDDILVLRGYASSLCEYLKVELTGTNGAGVSRGKLKTMQAIDRFAEWNASQGIAEILMALPRQLEFSSLACYAFGAIKKVDPGFFSREDNSMSRKDLVHLPRTYGLDEPENNSQEYLEAAAKMYQETVKDTKLRFAYGEMDLSWIADLHSPELVISLVRHTCEVGNLKMLRVGAMFREAGKENISVQDHDLQVRNFWRLILTTQMLIL